MTRPAFLSPSTLGVTFTTTRRAACGLHLHGEEAKRHLEDESPRSRITWINLWKGTGETVRSCELHVFNSDDRPDWAKLKVMPTVCLLALSDHLENDVLAGWIEGCLAVGTLSFAAWGEIADETEDRIDSVLEGESRLDVTTTSHQDEGIEETANFVVNAVCLEPVPFRCVLILDKRMRHGDRLLKLLERLCRNLPK